ncbi:MAG: hypothetical protein JWM99_2320, partial [Verrucomicrobiales bacterium]|nr:hypothetical protein [Verrucomicrobiales bacterium]
YYESGSVTTDLSVLRTTADGQLDDVQTLRNFYAADLVCLVTEYGPDYLFYGLQGPSAENAFSILRRPYLAGGNYLPVVLSFNFGCQMDPGHADSLSAFPFAYGYTFAADGKDFGTVEAPASPNRVPWFSNPNLFFKGIRTGIVEGTLGAADNAQAINRTAAVVAGFRGTKNFGIPPIVRVIPQYQPLPGSGQNLHLTVNASDPDGFVARVQFLVNGLKVGETMNPPFSFTITNMPYGSNLVTACAFDDSDLVTSDTALVTITNSYNDAFSSRQLIAGDKLNFSGNNTGASVEPGEPNHLPGYWSTEPQAFRSLWWEWVAPSDGKLMLVGSDSDAGGFISIYTGSGLTNLVRQAAAGGVNALELMVKRGTPYYIAGDTLKVGTITVSLSFVAVPKNDSFSDRTELTGTSVQFTIDSRQATPESNDPNLNAFSVWWKWNAPTSGTLFLTNLDNSAPPRFALYFGSNLANLLPVPAHQTPFGLAFDVVADQEYALEYTGLSALFDARLHLSTASLISPLPNSNGEPARFVYPANIPLKASVNAVDNQVRRIDFFALDPDIPSKPRLLLASVSAPPYVAIWSHPPRGTYEIYAEAVLTNGQIMLSLPVRVSSGPSNDMFADASLLTGTSFSAHGETRGATSEIDEPANPYWNVTGPSIWWKWIASGTGRISLTLSNTPFPNPLLVVYNGTNLTDLQIQGANSDMWRSSNTVFYSRAGETYFFRVSSAGTAAGEFDLKGEFEPAPINDDFKNAISVGSLHQRLQGDTRMATLEAGESRVSPAANLSISFGHSLWWRWTAPQSGIGTFTIADMNAHPFLTVFSGDSLEALTPISFNGHDWWRSPDPTLEFTAFEGQSYFIQIADSPTQIQSPFDVQLDLLPTPENDQFKNAIRITGESANILADTTLATLETGEQRDNEEGGHTLWWRWSAPRTGTVRLASTNSSSLPLVDVFKGESLANLVLLAGNHPFFNEPAQSETYLQAISGHDYFFQVDSRLGTVGEFTIVLDYVPPPANDQFANRELINDSTTIPAISNQAATSDSNEPTLPGATGSSLWWKYLAPASGMLRLQASGGSSVALVSVYQGSQLTNLQLLSSNIIGTTLTVVAGREYSIAVDTLYGQRGTISVASRFDRIPPENDNFKVREALTGPFATFSGNVSFATREPGEPPSVFPNLDRTVWFTWTSSVPATVTISPRSGSQLTISMVVYRGDSLTNLTKVAVFNDFLGGGATFPADAGVAYQFSVQGAREDSFYQGGDYNFQLIASSLTIVQPENGSESYTPGTIPILAQFTDFDGPQQKMEFFADGNSLGTITHSPWKWIWTNAPLGLHSLFVRATNPEGIVRESAPVTISALLANDSFANRQTESGPYLRTNISMVGATLEEGEPKVWEGGTVWISWKSPGSGPVHMNANYPGGFTGPGLAVYTGTDLLNLTLIASAANSNLWHTELDFDAQSGTTYQVAIAQRATSPSVLFEIIPSAENDDFEHRRLIEPGSTKVYGFTKGATREIDEPIHGGFTNAIGQSIWWAWTSPSNGVVSISIEGGQSVNGDYFILSPIVAVYTGDTLSNLAPVTSDASHAGRPASASFSAVAGVTYSIAVDLGLEPYQYFNEGFGADLSLRLEWDFPPLVAMTSPIDGSVFARGLHIILATTISDQDDTIDHVDFFNGNTLLGRVIEPPFNFTLTNQPAGVAQLHVEATDQHGGKGVSQFANIFIQSTNGLNDRFVDRFDLGNAAVADFSANISEATHDFNEPNHAGLNGRNSLWWQWTAPTDGQLTLTSEAGGHSPVMAVYTGNALENLLPIAATGLVPQHCETVFDPMIITNLTFPVYGGAHYQIAIDTYFVRSDPISHIDLKFTSLRMVDAEDVRYQLPGPVALVATYDPSLDGLFARLEFWDGTNLIGTALSPETMYVWRNPTPGHYHIRPVATRANGEIIEGIPRSFRIGNSVNDDFAAALPLGETPADMTGDNKGATSESGEPAISQNELGQTLWWRWKAPEMGTLVLRAAEGNVHPVMKVFAGTNLTDLFLVTTSVYDECTVGLCDGVGCRERQRQRILCGVQKGANYYIAVDGYRHDVCNGPSHEEAGTFSVNLDFHPLVNDRFDQRIQLTGYSSSRTNENIGATRELDEPVVGTNHFGRSVWYEWKAPRSGPVSVTRDGSTAQSQIPISTGGGISGSMTGPPSRCTVVSENPPVAAFIPVFSVFTGSELSTLQLVDSGTRVDFDAVAGTTYMVAVTGTGDASGEFAIHLDQAHPPANDNFASRIRLEGAALQVDGDNLGATRERGEPLHGPSTNAFRSVWWTWTAPSSGTVRLHAWYDYTHFAVRVYSGDSLSTLIPVTSLSEPGPVFFYAWAGSTYQIAVVGSGTESEFQGQFTLSLFAVPLPARISSADSKVTANGMFNVGIAGQKGQSFVLQKSDDLLLWENILTDTVLDGQVRYIDPDFHSSPQRFYRAVPLDSVSSLAPLRIRERSKMVIEGFPVLLQGNIGQSFILQASTNLTEWLELSRGIFEGNTLNWIDQDSAIYPIRYYRLLRPPQPDLKGTND